MSRTLSIRFAAQEISATVHADAEQAIAPVLAFVQPHFSVDPVDPIQTHGLPLRISPLADWTRPSGEPQRTMVRKGRSDASHVWGDLWQVEDRTVIEIKSSRTVFDLAADGSGVHVYVSDTSRYHLSDFLREAMWELAAVGGGTFIHAASVSNGQVAFALVGDKGAGKTTTALDLVRGGADFYSGDILHVTTDAGQVYSYPDYPGVCWGTIRANPELLKAAEELGLEQSPDDGAKVLMPHDIYGTALGVRKSAPPLPLGAIIIANVSAPGAARIESAAPRWDLLETLERPGSDPGEGWEPFLDEAGRRYARSGSELRTSPLRPDVPWYTRLGRGRPSPEEIAGLLDKTSQAAVPESRDGRS
ncbi:conserved hypothetical protein [Streptomyces scabiei 87.22]|uniref:Uncharacterized protein n=1 Tax=Streptomyces scabiei (strain 87.22) TaxID=680198 RepID=C9Z2B3_STRSW|nr:hypothetical protein [Streptomyces scabiei]MBP5868937.1 hypothetical protein [Streptomyces sp. LBUM 1485]CBG71127.1 conserved hypothetical protein [Streptomyces scabiei 87.22]MDX2883481.1 hypothetical protein [Streptomyces scabiei]MDX3026828.1 hypothetical protein [Streptomyces scabiei]MDX3080389.1 hypothetical protein [Streptomyces scabiei]